MRSTPPQGRSPSATSTHLNIPKVNILTRTSRNHSHRDSSVLRSLLTDLINNKLCLPQHIRIAKSVRVIIVFATEKNQTVAGAPALGHLHAAPGVSAEAVAVLEAGLLDEGTQSVFAVCKIGGSKNRVGAGDETYAALASVGLQVMELMR